MDNQNIYYTKKQYNLYLHDQERLEDSKIIWLLKRNNPYEEPILAVSQNGGLSYEICMNANSIFVSPTLETGQQSGICNLAKFEEGIAVMTNPTDDPKEESIHVRINSDTGHGIWEIIRNVVDQYLSDFEISEKSKKVLLHKIKRKS